MRAYEESFRETAQELDLMINALAFEPEHVYIFVGTCKVVRSLQWQTALAFLSPYAQGVLRRMRASSSRQSLKPGSSRRSWRG